MAIRLRVTRDQVGTHKNRVDAVLYHLKLLATDLDPKYANTVKNVTLELAHLFDNDWRERRTLALKPVEVGFENSWLYRLGKKIYSVYWKLFLNKPDTIIVEDDEETAWPR